ncbi:MAG TPA: DUF456 domain-containing protein [Candidatus Methylomirabilis sp.]|nr:DUF456 domain-containing protein [Candidatus Methylomirabilis sp.]
MNVTLIGAEVVVAVLLLAGLVGSVVPFLPGPPLILLAALVHAFATGFNLIGPGRLAILASLTVLAQLLDYLAAAVGTKKFGGSGWAVAGAVVGGIVGFFFGPLGLLLGPVLGAVAGELLKRGDLRHSLKAGLGTLIGMLLGAAARFTLAVSMAGLFLWWIWRG